ncbi:MexE family multidrug efflux RND transporter periplasmic adaptor subunit [Labrys miyagiensis]
MRPFVAIAAVVVLAGGMAGGYLLWQKLGTGQASTLMTAVVTRGDVEETVLATGTLKPVRLVAVGAQVSGRIISVKVRLGQEVKAGDLIAEIDSVTQQNSLQTAQASLANVKAQLAEKQATLILNRQTLTRQKSMVAQRAVSQADFESADAAVNVTLAQIEALQADITEAQVAVETARVNLDYTKIKAPIDGTVLSVVSQEGQTVNAVQSAPTIVILGQLDTMTVRTEISEADVIKVTPGLPVYFTVLGAPDIRYSAQLESIEPAPESIRSDSSFSSSTSSTSSTSSSTSSSSDAIYYNGIFDVPNRDGRLRTYMTAEVHIVLGRSSNVLVVPSAALGAVKEGNRYMVRIQGKDGTVLDREVKIGLNNKVTAEVLSGLAEGERVVTGEVTQQAASTSSSGPGGPPPMGL